MAVGLNSTLVPLYIKEYTPVQMRGSVGSLNQILLNVGLFTAFTLGLYFKFSYSSGLPSDHESDSSFWRVILLIPIATSLIRTFVLLKYFKLNPATYYMGEGNIEKVVVSLKSRLPRFCLCSTRPSVCPSS
jgi:SP family facilitated glucose transporter-like MFS transporter 1